MGTHSSWCSLLARRLLPQPPDLEILEIGDLSRDRFRGIFRLTYSGDAHLVLSTKVQANPLSKPTPSSGASSGRGLSSGQDEETFTPFSSAGSSSRGILFAAAPLIVPMKLRLSHVRLRAIIVLVVSKTKGITLVFKNDPLESVQVSSTFDSVAVIAKYLQQEIEGQLKEVFREDLPGIIHRLSQKWLSGQSKRKTGTDAEQAPEKTERSSASMHGGEQDHKPAPPTSPKRSRKRSENSRKASSAAGEASSPPSTLKQRRGSRAASSKPIQPPLSSGSSSSAVPMVQKPVTGLGKEDEEGSFEIPPPLSTSFDDTESYDPTYGLRPDEVRLPKDGKGFKGLKGLKKGGGALGGRSSMGLGGLLEDIQSSRQEDLHDAEVFDAEDEALEQAEAEDKGVDEGESEWAEEDGLDRMGELDEALYDEQDGRHLPQAATRRVDADAHDSDVQAEEKGDVASDSSLSSLEDDHSPESASHLLDDIERPDFDPFDDVHASDGFHPPSVPRGGASATGSRSNGRLQRESTPLSSSSPRAKRQSLATIEALRGGAFRSSGSTPSLGSFGTGSGSRRVGAGVGLSGSDAGYGFMPLSASMRAASVLNAAERAYGNKAASTSGRRSTTAGISMSASASLSNLASARSPTLSRCPSSGLQSLSGSRPRPPTIRPRIFHSSSLIRPVDPTVYRGDAGDASVDEGSLYPVSNWTGSVRGGRSESVGGGSTTIYGGGGGAESSRSGPGSSRTFTIKRKHNGASGASTARSAGSATGSGGGGASTVMEEGVDSGRMPARQTLTRASSTLSNLLGQRGWDWGVQGSREDGLHSQEEPFEGNLPTSSSTSSLDEPGSSSRSHSHSNSFSGSGSRAGTLSTLEPEPMDETSLAYKRQLEKEKLGGLVRVGWDGVDANETTTTTARGAGGGGGGRGTAVKSSSVPPRRSGVSGSATPLGLSNSRATAGISPSTSHPRYLHLQDLVASNQTLSPYTRLSDTRGWAVRSTPGTPGAGSGGEGSLLGQVRDGWKEAVQDVEARRRRTFNLGGRAGAN